jgi:hypothetical protein
MHKRDLFGRYLLVNPRKRKPKEPLTARAKLLRRRLRRRIKEIESLSEPWKGKGPSAQPQNEGETKLFSFEENKQIDPSYPQNNKSEPLNPFLKDQIHFEFIDVTRFDDDIEWQLVTELILEETAKLNRCKGEGLTIFPDDRELDKEVEEILRNPLPPIKRGSPNNDYF